MYNQIKYLASWTKVKMNDRLGQRGAEMVEYAIVLACVAAVAAIFYTTSKPTSNTDGAAANTLSGALDHLWSVVKTKISAIK